MASATSRRSTVSDSLIQQTSGNERSGPADVSYGPYLETLANEGDGPHLGNGLGKAHEALELTRRRRNRLPAAAALAHFCSARRAKSVRASSVNG